MSAVKRPSQCDLIAGKLADGRWHTVAEIHRCCGFSRLNSRVAELRSRRGMVIECRHVPGQQSGSEAYEYRFVGVPEGGSGLPHVSSDLPSGIPAQPTPAGGATVGMPELLQAESLTGYPKIATGQGQTEHDDHGRDLSGSGEPRKPFPACGYVTRSACDTQLSIGWAT